MNNTCEILKLMKNSNTIKVTRNMTQTIICGTTFETNPLPPSPPQNTLQDQPLDFPKLQYLAKLTKFY